jgi:predicted peroxiredoxin
MGQVMVHNTHGKEDVERASLAFVVGNTALSSGQEASVLLTIELAMNYIAPAIFSRQQWLSSGRLMMTDC